MAKYATTEKTWDCWVCGTSNITLREMWSTEERPWVKRCPKCNDNIIIKLDHGGYDRAAAFWTPPEYYPL